MRIILDTLREQGRSQKWLADRLGVNPMTLSRYLHGSRNAPDDVMRRACELLGLPINVVQHVSDFPSGNSEEKAA